MTKKIARLLAAAALLGLCLAPAFPATATGFSGLVGSWELTAVNDDTGAVSEALITYERGGTVIATGPSVFLGTAHGAWERTGPRSFEATFVNFVYDNSGGIVSKVHNRHSVEIGPGGSYTAHFVAEVSLPDGTVVDVLTSTVTGQRIEP